MKKFAGLLLVLCLAAVVTAAPAQAQSIPFAGQVSSISPNYPLVPVVSLTATAQTSTEFLGVPGASYAGIVVTGTTLTTATWALQGSINGGTTWVAIATAPLGVTPLVPVLTETSTVAAGSSYAANVAGFTRLRFVTSGTFTATGLKIQVVVTSNKGLL